MTIKKNPEKKLVLIEIPNAIYNVLLDAVAGERKRGKRASVRSVAADYVVQHAEQKKKQTAQ